LHAAARLLPRRRCGVDAMRGMRVFLVLLFGWKAWSQQAPQRVLFRPPVEGLNRWEGLLRTHTGIQWEDRGAQLIQESGGNPRAVSPVGAQGLMQAMPRTWAWYQAQGWVPRSASPLDPSTAIQGGHLHMRYLEGLFQGDWHQALGAFNAGQGNVLKARALARSLGLQGPDAWLRALPRITGEAHSRETSGYVTRIPRLAAEIRRQRAAP
jgi:membrane-bound lytic murein transglycosylase MltF